MQHCFQIKPAPELIKYLNQHGLTDDDFNYQLSTNAGFVFELKNDEVVFLPYNLSNDGLLFNSRDCFKQTLDADWFPIENPNKDLYQVEIERIKTINKQIDFYHDHLNKILKFDFTDINREVAQSYIRKLIGRTIKQLTTETDIVALIAVIGEVLRREINGNWVLVKWYGMYNPYYIPKLLTPENRIIPIGDTVFGHIKWKTADLSRIWTDREGLLTLKETRKRHECIVLHD